MKKVLIIEDNRELLAIIKFNLIKNNFEVFSVENANDGLIILEDTDIDIILLDLMLPGLSGEEFLRIIKNNKRTRNIPVIIISAKKMENDIVSCLKEGADDYLTKPFSIKVLLAKIEAVLRRASIIKAEKFEYKGIEIDTNSFKVRTDGKEINLTKKEFELLNLFIQNPKRVFTREQLLDKIWGYSSEVYTRTVDAHISSIRKKLGQKGKLIKSIPKVGYLIE